MKKIIPFLAVVFVTLISLQSCQKDTDDAVVGPINPTVNLEVQNFIWKGLNQYYLWQTDVTNLADNRFANQTALDAFLINYKVPQDLFDALRVSPTIDRFSWMVDDYVTLEQSLQGTSKNNGVEFGLSYKPNSTTEVFGYVRYIIAGSDAATKDIKRGEMFTAVNGTQLTVNNYESLVTVFDTFSSDPPTIVIDKINLMPTLMKKIPLLSRKYIALEKYPGYYLLR